MKKKLKKDLWLLVLFMDVKNVFEFGRRKTDTRPAKVFGLHIADNEDGDWDFDSGPRMIEYHISLDKIAPVVCKVREELAKIKSASSLLRLAKLERACITMNISEVFPATISGIHLINSENREKESIKRMILEKLEKNTIG